MMKTVETRPYEFLIRWKNGVISGAHVGFEDVILEAGVVSGTVQQNVQAVNVGLGKGFPLADILGQIQIDALTEKDAALAAKSLADSKCAEHAATIATLEASLASLQKQSDAQIKEIVALKTPVDIAIAK